MTLREFLYTLLFAVNAGSGTVSSFAVSGATLSLLNTVSTGGSQPTIAMFAVQEDGGLVNFGQQDGLPASAGINGITAY